jgi:hypothetical protein
MHEGTTARPQSDRRNHQLGTFSSIRHLAKYAVNPTSIVVAEFRRFGTLLCSRYGVREPMTGSNLPN